MSKSTFEVRITIQAPYPKEYMFRVVSQQPHTAISRAWKLFKEQCSKRVKTWRIDVVKLV